MGIFFGLNVVRKQEVGELENWVPKIIVKSEK